MLDSVGEVESVGEMVWVREVECVEDAQAVRVVLGQGEEVCVTEAERDVEWVAEEVKAEEMEEALLMDGIALLVEQWE